MSLVKFNRMVKLSYLDLSLHALSDSTRREILQTLSKNPLNVSELYKKVCKSKMLIEETDAPVIKLKEKMSLPAFSKHLKVLENSKLVLREKDGREYKFSLTKYAHFWLKDLGNLEKFLVLADQN